MIPNKTDTTVQSNLTGKKIAMRFDAAATIHLMGVMTDIAKDPEKYLLTEYSTNAKDSHIEAGVTRPIEVNLPSELRPTLTIKDYGVGLDLKDIEEVYSLYGASTKRETNEQTGALGLGCKSALSYTSQFNVVGIKNGVKTMVSVSRDEDGSASMTVVEEIPTDEANGVEIIVPTKKYNKFEQKAQNLFRFWPKGSVLVNGQEPERVDGLTVSDSMLLVEKKQYDELDVVIMGDVPYEVPREVSPLGENRHYYGQHSHGYILVARVPLGDLDFTPSREALQLSQRTKNRMAQLKVEYEAAVTKAVQKEVDKCASVPDALAKAREWYKALHGASDGIIDGLVFKGKEIPKKLEFSDDVTTARKNSRTLSSCSESNNIYTCELVEALLVDGFNVKFTATHKKKLNEYADQKGLTVENFVLTEKKLKTDLVDSSRRVDWDTIKNVVLQAPQTWGYGNRAKLISGSYPAWLPIGHEKAEDPSDGEIKELAANDIDQTEPIYYFMTDTYAVQPWEFSQVIKLFRTHEPKGTIVKLTWNRVEKFQRDFPEAKKMKEHFEDCYNNIVSALGDEVVEAWEIQETQDGRRLKKLNASKILDPELKKAVRLSKLAIETKIKPVKVFREHRMLKYLTVKALTATNDAYCLSNKYPLLSSPYISFDGVEEDVQLYVNAKYKETK